MSSWTTTKPGSSPLRDSLVKRAKQREVYEGKTENVYVVVGNTALGDSYDRYIVERLGDGLESDDFKCDCQSASRQGSQYRKVCSHITGVVLHINEHGDWQTEEVPDPADEPELDFIELAATARPDERAARKAISEDAEPEDLEEEIEEVEEDEEEDQPEENPTPVVADLPLTEKGTLDIEDPRLWQLFEDPAYLPLPAQIRVHESEPDLPTKFQGYRASQWRAVLEVEAALEDGVKVVFVSAPTGSGKTLIAESVRRLRGVRAIYTCTTKLLQDQILEEFEYAHVLKGRSNYPTLDNPNVTALDCTKQKQSLPACQNCPGWSKGSSWGQAVESDAVGDWDDDEPQTHHCNWCHPWQKCPYQIAKREASMARLGVLNTAYFLATTNFVANSPFIGRPLVLIDEADMLEEELMRFIEVTITAKDREMLGVGLPEKKTVSESWGDWIELELIPAIRNLQANTKVEYDLFGNPDVKTLRRKARLKELLQKAYSLIKAETDEDGKLVLDENGEKIYHLNEGFVYTGYEKDWKTGEYPPDDKVNVTFKPVVVREQAPRMLWNKAQQFVLLSATLISPAQMAYDLGLEDDEWTTVEVPSSFPVLQRPIIPTRTAQVIHKNMHEAIPKLIDKCDEILREHPDERILIHSVSYKLTNDLTWALKKKGHGDRISTYSAAWQKEEALKRYLARPNGVMVAPSLDRGVDLPAEDCRVIIVAKVPYLNTMDKQVSARLHGTGKAGKTWFAVQAIRTLCQMTGRGMRSAEDSCRTYVLDEQFNKLYSQNRRLFPKWWADAIVWDPYDPKWKGMA